MQVSSDYKHLVCARYQALSKIDERDKVCALVTFIAGEGDRELARKGTYVTSANETSHEGGRERGLI